MKAYLVLDFSISNLPAFMEYVEKIPKFLIKHQGRYLVEGRTPEVLEGDWRPDTIVLLEFDSQSNIDNFLSDPEVKSLFRIRHQHTKSNLIRVASGSWRDEIRENA